jgi:hypothetical protein
MAKKKPNYTARRTGAMGALGGTTGAAGAIPFAAERLAAAGLGADAAGVAGHIIGSGAVGAGMAAGGYLAYKGVKAAKDAVKRHRALRDEQFNK